MRRKLRSHPESQKLAKKPRVDRSGHGRINGLSLATVGPAVGHGFEMDGVTIAKIVELGEGAKGRWTHGNLCADGIGRHLGRWENLRSVGGHAVGDFVFSPNAHKLFPDGLSVSAAEFLMDTAETEPDTIGVSIVFDGDVEELGETETLKPRIFARPTKVPRADFVGDPAANPLGLFAGTGSELSESATNQLDEIVSELGEDRVLQFCLSYWGGRGKDMLRKLMEGEAPEAPDGQGKGEEGADGNGTKARAGIAEAEENGWTHEEIGEATDRSASVIGAIKSGEIKDPPQDFLDMIDALNAKGPKEEPEGDGGEMSSGPTVVVDAELSAQVTNLTGTIEALKATVKEQAKTLSALRTERESLAAKRRTDYVEEIVGACLAAGVTPPSKDDREGIMKALNASDELGRIVGEAVRDRCLSNGRTSGSTNKSLEAEGSEDDKQRKKFCAGVAKLATTKE